MAGHKWDLSKCLLLPLPFLLLAAFLLDIPFALPSFLLPERRYIALDSAAGPAALKAARGGAFEAFAALGDSLQRLPKAGFPEAAFSRTAALFPDRPSIDGIAEDIARGLPPLRKALVLSSEPLLADEIAGLDAAARRAGLPLAFETLPAPSGARARLPLATLSYRLEATAKRLDFELLFLGEARKLATIEVLAAALPPTAPALWRGSGRDLPSDLVLRLSAAKTSLASGLLVQSLAEDGSRASLELDLGTGLETKPRVLVITGRGDRKSFIDSLYPTVHASPAEAAALDLHAYELIVLDGLPLSSIRGSLLARLLEVQTRRTGSLLFAADSPDFGKKGDNPTLEALLPVSLMPRNLKELPDLAILILLDTSGSMFGTKLSLAKVAGLELLKELKATDRVGMLLFDDGRRWAYDFQLNREIVAAPLLEPVSAEGGTDLASALIEGLDRLAGLSIRERHAVVISDGVTRPADFQALAAKARSLGVTISTMGVGEDLNRSLLERLALETGGRFYRVASADEIPSLLFEDRKNEARPPFLVQPTPILALSGQVVATIGGMAVYTAAEPATVLFADRLGDPLLASREYSNRAVLVFASDLYGGYTKPFFDRREAASVFRDRLDALFAERPLEVSVLEGGRSLSVLVRSDALAEPRLLLTAPGRAGSEVGFKRSGPSSWKASLALAHDGPVSASIVDRGTSLASFGLAANGGLSGREAADALALAAQGPLAFRTIRSPVLWLLFFFASCLGVTVLLRVKR